MALALLTALMLAVDPAPQLVDGGTAAPDAWAARSPGGLSVCWSPGPDCFAPVRVDGTRAADQRRLAPGWAVAFVGPARAIIVDPEGWVWALREGQRDPTPWRDAAPLPARPRPPRRLQCSATGPLPVRRAGALVFDWVPCTDGPGAAPIRCAVRIPPPPRRRIPALGVALWFEAVVGGGRAHADEQADRHRGATIVAGLSLAIDPSTRNRARRARASALAGRVRTTTLPPVTPGPLAVAQRDALWRALCEGPPPWSANTEPAP